MMPPLTSATPPSGEVPILFNDHHVYTKPDRLKENRVLAALVRGNEILVPLRSMFEQMGATVSYDPASKTADVSKPGSDVKVTVGKPEVVINGESRPLDVPPEIYKGAIVVPVRVISEGMGAYVQWVPEKKVVVVRYVAAPVPTPPPTAPPTAPPTPPTGPAAAAAAGHPAAAPTPTPAPPASRVYEHFIVGDYIFKPKVYNEFSNGTNTTTWGPSYAGRAAVEFPLFNMPWMIEGYGEQYAYTHPGGYGIGNNTPCDGVRPRRQPGLRHARSVRHAAACGCSSSRRSTAMPACASGSKSLNPRVYVAGSYLVGTNNYGYPRMTGFGFGVEKLPDLDKSLSLFGSFYYFPQLQGNFTDASTGIGYHAAVALPAIPGRRDLEYALRLLQAKRRVRGSRVHGELHDQQAVLPGQRPPRGRVRRYRHPLLIAPDLETSVPPACGALFFWVGAPTVMAYEVTKHIKGRDYRYRVESSAIPKRGGRTRWTYLGQTRGRRTRRPVAIGPTARHARRDRRGHGQTPRVARRFARHRRGDRAPRGHFARNVLPSVYRP